VPCFRRNHFAGLNVLAKNIWITAMHLSSGMRAMMILLESRDPKLSWVAASAFTCLILIASTPRYSMQSTILKVETTNLAPHLLFYLFAVTILNIPGPIILAPRITRRLRLPTIRRRRIAAKLRRLGSPQCSGGTSRTPISSICRMRTWRRRSGEIFSWGWSIVGSSSRSRGWVVLIP